MVGSVHGMTINQLTEVVNQATNHLNNATRAANAQDVYTACSEGKKALKLFWSINPKMDVPPQAMNSYDYANDQMRVFATVYLDVCVR